MRFCFFREYLVIFFLLICLFFVEPFPNLEPFPNPSLKGREMGPLLLPLLQERVGERLQLQERVGERLQGWGEASSIKKPRTMCNRAGLDCYSISRKRGVTC